MGHGLTLVHSGDPVRKNPIRIEDSDCHPSRPSRWNCFDGFFAVNSQNETHCTCLAPGFLAASFAYGVFNGASPFSPVSFALNSSLYANWSHGTSQIDSLDGHWDSILDHLFSTIIGIILLFGRICSQVLRCPAPWVALFASLSAWIGFRQEPVLKNRPSLCCPLRLGKRRLNRHKAVRPRMRATAESWIFAWLILSMHVTPTCSFLNHGAPHYDRFSDDFVSDASSMIELSGVIFALQLHQAETSQAVLQQPQLVVDIENDPVLQETARLEEAFQRTWRLFAIPRDVYACLLRPRRLATVPPMICSFVENAMHLAFAKILRLWPDMADRDWGISITRLFHPVFVDLETFVMILLEPSVTDFEGSHSVVAAEVIAEDSRGLLVSSLQAIHLPSPMTASALLRHLHIIPCDFISCEVWANDHPVAGHQDLGVTDGLHVQVYIPKYAFMHTLTAAGISGSRWLELWCDRHQTLVAQEDRFGLHSAKPIIKESGQLSIFRCQLQPGQAASIVFDVRTTTVDAVLEQLILEQWPDLIDDNWRWLHTDDSWHLADALAKFAHVMVAYDEQAPGITILVHTEYQPAAPPVRTFALQVEEVITLPSLLIQAGVSRECMFEPNDCRFRVDGKQVTLMSTVRVRYGSFFHITIRSDEDEAEKCLEPEYAEDIAHLMQRPPAAPTVTDGSIHQLPFRTWFRATIWLNLERLNDQCHSILTTVVFKVPLHAPWEPLALQELASSIPFSADRQNGKVCKIVRPQPTSSFRAVGVHQLIVTDYWPQPFDIPILMDTVGTPQLSRSLIHFWSVSGLVDGHVIVRRRAMWEQCHEEGWCFFRYFDREFDLSSSLALRPFTFLELVFVPTPNSPPTDSECETMLPQDGLDQESLHTDTEADLLSENSETLNLLQVSSRALSFWEGFGPLARVTVRPYPVFQSLIVLLRLPPPGNGTRPKGKVRFDPHVTVYATDQQTPTMVYDMKVTNDHLAAVACTTDDACDNPFVLACMTQLGWGPHCSTPQGTSLAQEASILTTKNYETTEKALSSTGSARCILLNLDRLIPSSGQHSEPALDSKETVDAGKDSCMPAPIHSFAALSLPFDPHSSLGLEVQWATELHHSFAELELHPNTQIALGICPPLPFKNLKAVHVYTDGSCFDSKIVEGEFFPALATWSFVVLSELMDGTFAYVGFLAGDVITENDPRWETAGIGAARHDPLTAERCALYWAIAWGHHLSSTLGPNNLPAFHLHFDCLAAGWEASGVHGPTIDCMSILAIALRSFAIRLETRVEVQYHHVHGHSGQPWNEFADSAARSRAKKRIEDLTPSHFLSPLRTNKDYLMWSTSWEAAPSGFDPQVDTQTLWLRGFDACLPTTFSWTPFLHQTVEAPKTCSFKGLVSSYNVMTLKKRGALELLRLQCYRKGLHVVGLQETRDRASQFWSHGNYFRFTSAADPQGQGGLQLWINRDAPFLFVQGKPLNLTPRAFTVVTATPRILRVHCHAGGFHVVFLVAHAPHSTHSDATAWWSNFRSICSDIKAEAHQILMIRI